MAQTFAGFFGLPNGMNSGVDAKLLRPTEFARGNNVSVRGGFVETRGGFVSEYECGTGFRGGKVWRLNSGDRIVFVMNQDVVVYDPNAGTATTLAGQFTAGTSWCFFEQADRWMVIQNGIDRPTVLDMDATDTPIVFGTIPPEVCLVKATVMQYLHQRLFMVPVNVPSLTPDPTAFPNDIPIDDPAAGPGELTFCAADVRDNLVPERLFRMTEHRVVAQGGCLTLPAELGFIEAMGLLRGASTGTGVGPLIVFGREGVCAFDVSIPRAQWLSTNIGQVLFEGAGTRSSRALVTVNDDLAYHDSQGQIRTLRYDKANLAGAGGVLYNTPRSNEMKYWISQSDPLYFEEVSATFVDNRFFWTLIGEPGATYKALGVLDMIPAYSMSGVEAACYYGAWTGFDFHQVVKARKNQVSYLYAWAKSASGAVHLLRYDDDAITDPNSTPIKSTIVTGFFNLAPDGVAMATDVKRLDYVELWLENLKRDTTFEVYYRPRGYAAWTLLGSKAIQVPGGEPQARRQVKIALDLSSDGCNAIDKKPLMVSDRFQFMIRWTGWSRIEMFRAVGTVVAEEDPDVCEVDNEDLVSLVPDTMDPDFDYEVTL